MHRIDIVCPFCLENVGRWKMFRIVKKTYEVTRYEFEGTSTKHVPIRVKKVTDEIESENDAKKWEQQVLRNHLPLCIMKDNVSLAVLKHYNIADFA